MSDDQRMREFIRGLPKAELHVHLEGTLERPMRCALSARNGVELPAACRTGGAEPPRFSGLQSFLDEYYAGVSVLRSACDFSDLTAAYLHRARADGVRHAEVFFDPQSHTARGVRLATVVEGIRRALVDGERELGVSSRLIMCFLRDRGPADAFATLEAARPYRYVIAGVGLDSAEAGHPPGAFAGVFRRARAMGLRAVAHAGEEGPAASVREALDLLGVARIDHGTHAADDPALVRRLARERIPLTMCPLSNLMLRVTPDLSRHPLKRLLEAGVVVTVNSDDPAYFGGYIAENYAAAARALGLGRGDLVTLARNSITASWLPAERRPTSSRRSTARRHGLGAGRFRPTAANAGRSRTALGERPVTGSWPRLPVDGPSLRVLDTPAPRPDPDHQHPELALAEDVDDAVVADAEAPQRPAGLALMQAAEAFAAARICDQTRLDGRTNA